MNQHTPVPDRAPLTGERYRPFHHFTPRRNWMNDPNGLVFFDGEYHLFYQYNPHGIDWGHMSWGHAVSADLLHWEELPVAIPETDRMIFSGCCVIDWDNVSGLGDGSLPPMLAYFTAYDEAAQRQTQHLAYSHDRGRSFTHYAHNPIIDLDLEHFRDPKVFWYADTGQWIMAVALPREHKVRFYRSTDLLHWDFASDFGPAGATGGQWECPDIFLVPVEGRPGERHWVLKVDVDDKLVDGGSGAQYFVGHFDGTCFEIDGERGSPDGDLVDLGPDFYAAVTWSDLPSEQPGPMWIGWMSNHQTGKDYPTNPWRGAQSLPRTLFLFEEGERLRLGQRPVEQAEGTMPPDNDGAALVLEAGGRVELATSGLSFARHLAFSCTQESCFSLTLVAGNDELLSIGVDRRLGQVVFRRYASEGLGSAFARHATAKVGLSDQITIDIHFDGYLVEIFLDRGARIYSGCLFPDGAVSILMECISGTVQVA